MMISEPLSQYEEILKDAIRTSMTESGAKLAKTFQTLLIEILTLYMILPRKINFTQMARYGKHGEQTYRQNFNRKKKDCIDWLLLKLSLARRVLDMDGLRAIAIDPCYISKAGKKTPHIGRFWSGCAGAVKHGLEIMGVGLLDAASNKCMMLRAHQTIGNSALKMRNKILVEYYICVMKRYSKKLLSITDIVVADAFFSTSTFEKGMSELGFYLVSRFRDNASFASLNAAKVFMKDNGMDNSMAKVKSLMFNANYTNLIFDMSRCRPNRTLISKIVKELIGWQPKAA